MDRSIQDNTLILAGQAYERGLGVHAVSEMVYDLPPQARSFSSVVGVDDEMFSFGRSSVVFEVFLDDLKVAQSPIMRPGDAAVLTADIPAGSRQIRLTVGDAGDGMDGDHADWANAGFRTSPQMDSQKAR